jgi:two-component system response regulator YesN
MFKVLLIDADASVVEGMKVAIDWELYGYEVIGEEYNGMSGLDKIINLTPNIVITDITLPVIDGIEMIQRAKKLYPNFFTIFLTYHEDFDYTIEAIKLGASAYILKEKFKREEFYKLLIELKNKLTDEISKSEIESQLTHELNNNLHLTGETIINQLLQGTYSVSEDVKKNAKLYGYSFNKEMFILTMIELDNSSLFVKNTLLNYAVLLRSAILNLIEGILRKNQTGIAFSRSCREYFILYNYNPNIKDNVFEQVKVVSKDIQQQVNMLIKDTVSIYISKSANEINDIPVLFKQIMELKRIKFYMHSEVIISYSDIFRHDETFGITTFDYKEILKDYENSLLNRDIEGMKGIVSEFIDKACMNAYDISKVKHVIGRMFFALSDYMEKQILKYSNQNVQVPVEKINDLQTIFELKEILLEHSEKAIKLVSDTSIRSKDNKIMNVIEYINKHINEPISLKSVSDYVSMNNSYFSRYFKSKTGENFSDYLTKLRVDNAKKLLISSCLTIDEIANKVGYNNTEYFMKVFKKFTKSTCSEFRKSNK